MHPGCLWSGLGFEGGVYIPRPATLNAEALLDGDNWKSGFGSQAGRGFLPVSEHVAADADVSISLDINIPSVRRGESPIKGGRSAAKSAGQQQ